MNYGLEGKVVLITGASSGIGRATAAAFGGEGSRVAVAYRSNEAGALETAAEVEAGGGEAATVKLDLGDPGSIDTAVREVTGTFGPVDVLVNNAMEWPDWPAPGELFETEPPERLARSLRANLEGPYRLSQAVVGPMRARGWGRIVHVSTGLVEDGFPGSGPYVVPKAGLHGLARVMSRDLASSGILTNVVMAGFTPGERAVPEAVLAKAREAAATGRVTEPREVAASIVFLCSGQNTNVTGEAVRVDGHFLSPG
jgi:3-oxoacyl-[acyl-carrier protein] reductase